jgi:hypothetical protein
MTSRIQISIEPDLARRARTRASRLGISLAETICRLIREDVRGDQPKADISQIIGLGDSGGTNIARDKKRLWAKPLHRESSSAYDRSPLQPGMLLP